VSGEQCEAAIDTVVAGIDLIDIDPNDDRYFDLFNVDQDDSIQAQVEDMTAFLDPTLLNESLNQNLYRSRLKGSYGPQDNRDDGLWISFDSAAAHAEIPKGITKEVLASIWGISEEEARRILEVTTQLNLQCTDGSLSRRAIVQMIGCSVNDVSTLCSSWILSLSQTRLREYEVSQ
jgi:hypothetical protein